MKPGLTIQFFSVVVLAQLVECLPQRPDIRGSNLVISKLFTSDIYLSTVDCIVKTKIKKKESANGPFKKLFKFIRPVAERVDRRVYRPLGHGSRVYRDCRNEILEDLDLRKR